MQVRDPQAQSGTGGSEQLDDPARTDAERARKVAADLAIHRGLVGLEAQRDRMLVGTGGRAIPRRARRADQAIDQIVAQALDRAFGRWPESAAAKYSGHNRKRSGLAQL